MRAAILACVALSLTSAATELRFRSEVVRDGSGQTFWDNAGVRDPVGLINRVRYRITADSSKIEREGVLDPDPQKGTRARPRVASGDSWTREPITFLDARRKAIAWGDFDKDGSDELLTGWPAAIWKRGPGGKWARLASIAPLKGSGELRVADLNGDGLADIVMRSGNTYSVEWNETRLHFVRHVIATGFRNQSAVAAKFAGNGSMDVIDGDIENERNLWLFVAPDWKRVLLRSGIRVIQSEALDIDGDGDIDFIGAQYHPGLVFWLEHPARPLAEPWTYHFIDDAESGVDGVHGLAVADLDGDGRQELVSASGWTDGHFPDSIAWFRIPKNPRNAARWERFIIADRDAPGFNHYVSVGDVNGDGKPDVASAAKAGPAGNWFAWWEQPSDITRPWKKHVIATGQEGATNIVIADINGDGRADFVASRGHGRGVVLVRGAGVDASRIG